MKNVFFSLSVFFIFLFSCQPTPQTNNDGMEDETISQVTIGLPIPFEEDDSINQKETTTKKTVKKVEVVENKADKPKTQEEKPSKEIPKPTEEPSREIKLTPQEKPVETSEPTPKLQEAPKAESNEPKEDITETLQQVEIKKPIPSPKPNPAPEPKPAQLDHSPFDVMLQEHVSNKGNVNYKGFITDKRKLDEYVLHLEKFPPQRNWSKEKEMAYWINAYNAWTIKVILENYPVNSITDIDGGKTWKVKRVKSGDKTYSLDEVENAILRPKFKDARIHFAVNCAAKSCPPLWNHAWTANNLETQLDIQTKKFINNPSYNSYTKREASISKIFEWYASDFGEIKTYLNKYLDKPLNDKVSINFSNYNWNLNL